MKPSIDFRQQPVLRSSEESAQCSVAPVIIIVSTQMQCVKSCELARDVAHGQRYILASVAQIKGWLARACGDRIALQH